MSQGFTKEYGGAAPFQSPLTTKGDLHGFDTADARFPVGTNGHVVTADSSEALGVKWAAVPPSASTAFHAYAIEGTWAVGTGTYRLPITTAQTIVRVRVMCGTAPTGASAIFDVNKNGTTIYTTQGNRPTIAAAAQDSGAGTAPDVTALAAGDYLSIDIDQIGSSVAGADGVLVVEVTVP